MSSFWLQNWKSGNFPQNFWKSPISGVRRFFFKSPKINIFSNFQKSPISRVRRRFFFFLSPKSKIWKFPQNFLKISSNVPQNFSKFPLFGTFFRKFPLFFVTKVTPEKNYTSSYSTWHEWNSGLHQIYFEPCLPSELSVWNKCNLIIGDQGES